MLLIIILKESLLFREVQKEEDTIKRIQMKPKKSNTFIENETMTYIWPIISGSSISEMYSQVTRGRTGFG